MLIDKYIISGGEDLSVLIKSNQSSEALTTFKKWRSFCSESCNKMEKDCLFFTPLSNDCYFLMKSVFENRSGARALIWILGIELAKSDFLSIGSYDSVAKGFRNITINQIRKAYDSNGKPFDVNFRFPRNTFIEEYSFEDIKGKDFKGQYPQKFDEFTEKLSNSSLDLFFEKLCIAVNPHEYREEFTCMIGNNIPSRLIIKNTESVVDADVIQEKPKTSKKVEINIDKSSGEYKTINNTSNNFGAKKLSAIFFILIISICMNFILFTKNKQLSKNANEIDVLNAVRISLEKRITELKKEKEDLTTKKIQAEKARDKAQKDLEKLEEDKIGLIKERNKAQQENTENNEKLGSINKILNEIQKSSKGLKTKIDKLEDGNKKYGGYSKNEWKDNHSKLDEKITEIDNLLN